MHRQVELVLMADDFRRQLVADVRGLLTQVLHDRAHVAFGPEEIILEALND